ncbi:MAG: glycosyltransferase [Rhodospirillales bacterium]|nr:glycosyltransferase [Rhodospirillales bacterium]MSP80383.1 glycosyltransferase [Rhodospirillales bacterium]
MDLQPSARHESSAPAARPIAVSVVLPMLNEAENAAPLIAEIVTAFGARRDWEIVCVDDGSSDGTAERLKALMRTTPTLRLVRHARRAGQSAAISTGVGFARGTTVVTLDGDGQNDPADVPGLLAAWQAALERERLMIVGYRARRRDSGAKRLSSRVANAVRSGILGDDTPDTGCGLKVFARAAFLAFPAFDHMHRFLPALMLQAGGRVQSIPVNHRPRMRGQSNYGTFDRLWIGIVDLFGVMWLGRRRLTAVAREEPRP